jgi:hypothetical protein
MKLRIAEAEPGELVSRAVDAVRVIERITGRSLLREDLCKGPVRASEGLRKADAAEKQINQTPAQFEYPVISESVKRGGKEVERIRKLMVSRMSKVLDEGR